jgi:hypothetical protein
MTSIAALPQSLDLQVYAGDDFTFTITVGGSIGSITGWTVTAQIRATAANSSVLGSFTASIGGSNVITITLPHTVSASLPAVAVWDCQLTDPSGKNLTIVTGNITVTPEVTRP